LYFSIVDEIIIFEYSINTNQLGITFGTLS